MPAGGTQLHWLPLAPWERDGLKAALRKAGLPYDDIGAPGRFFWRFEEGDRPVGFGGLERHGDRALLRSVVTFPSLRRQGLGRAITAVLEGEAFAMGCRAVYLMTADEADFFEQQGYRLCDPHDVPAGLGASHRALGPDWAMLMFKRLS
jgi:N-acetylglutamate synthase-like GNAT family acetyltransferase